MPLGNPVDPYLKHNFAVEIEGLVAGGFQEVSGLESEIEVSEYREGGVNLFVHKLAGPVRYTSNLVFKHGMTDSKTLWDWYWDVMHGTISRKNLSVLLLDSAGDEKYRWNFENAYPVKWVGTDFNATVSEVAIETIEFAHRGLT